MCACHVCPADGANGSNSKEAYRMELPAPTPVPAARKQQPGQTIGAARGLGAAIGWAEWCSSDGQSHCIMRQSTFYLSDCCCHFFLCPVHCAVVVSPSKFAFESLNLSNIRDTLIRLEESVSRGFH